MEIAISTGLGFFFGIMACWVFWRYLLLKRPVVVIAKKVCITKNPETGREVIRFKIHNKGRNQVIGITLKAWICDLLEIPGGSISRGIHQLPVSNSETLTLAPAGSDFRPWGLTPERIYRSDPEFDVTALLSLPDHRILLTLRASDAVSGTTVVQQVTYTKDDVTQGHFKFGESVEVLPNGD